MFPRLSQPLGAAHTLVQGPWPHLRSPDPDLNLYGRWWGRWARLDNPG